MPRASFAVSASRRVPRLAVLLLASTLAAAALAACATPVAPSGGPPDTTPPALVSSLPAAGATRVSADEVVLTFSERLDPASAARAVRITPEPDTPPRVTARGRDLIVRLDSLRADATVVVTVTTDLTDARRVALRAPITVAFATGDRLDVATLAGTVRDPATGLAATGFAVWAYALADATSAPPDPSVARPDYRTETTADGSFRLAYLRAGLYAVAAVRDANRNGRADAGERFAAAPRSALRATEALARDSTAQDLTAQDSTARGAAAPPAQFWTTVLDTIPPAPRSVRALSDRRVAVRFTEAIRLADRGAFTVEDSVSGRSVAAQAFVAPEAPSEITVVAAEALANRPHRLRLADGAAVTDSSGTPAEAFGRTFTPAAQPDTVVARLREVLPRDSTLAPGTPLVLRWTTPPDGAALRSVRLTDASGMDLPADLETDDGVRYRLAFPGPGTFTVALPDSIPPRRVTVLGPDALGAIVGHVIDASGRTVVVEAAPGETPFGSTSARATVGPDGRFTIPDLRPGPVRLRFFADLDGDGRWTGGRLAPYTAPEPLALVPEPAVVRARWETDAGERSLSPPDR